MCDCNDILDVEDDMDFTRPVTIHELAIFRGVDPSGPVTGGDYEDVGLEMIGSCCWCYAQIAAYNAYPSRSGFWYCGECIGDEGWMCVRKANKEIFYGIHKEDGDE